MHEKTYRVVAAAAALCLGGMASSCALSDTDSVPEEVLDPEQHWRAIEEVQHALALDPSNEAAKARALELNGQMDRKATYTATTAQGTRAQFFVYDNGDAVIVETAKMGAPPTAAGRRSGSLEDVYRQMFPGKQLPRELVDARRRAKAVEDPGESAPSVLVAGPPANSAAALPKHGYGDCFHFTITHADDGVCWVPPDGNGNWCACDMTGDYPGGELWTTVDPAAVNPYTKAVYALGVFRGNVGFRVGIDGNGGAVDQIWSYNVLEGLLYFVMTTSAARKEHLSKTTSASGDGYHWSACFDKETTTSQQDCWYDP